MNRTICNPDHRNSVLEALTAEVAHAAYSVALRHERAGSWLDLELDLWRTLRHTVEAWGRRAPLSVPSSAA